MAPEPTSPAAPPVAAPAERPRAGRTVVVTGGSKGLGAGLVASFLDLGDKVATCSRSATADTEAWASHLEVADRFYHEAFDLRDGSASERFVGNVVERFGGVDVLVNNAGVGFDGVLALMKDEDIDAVLDLNLRASIQMTKLVSRRMLREGSGRIINITSIVGLNGYKGISVYSATKAALDGFTRALARELGPRGITVNSVAPGFMRTEMNAGSITDAQLRSIVKRTPIGRLAQPDEIAAAVRFLASDEAGSTTGNVLVVDGGLTV